VRVYRSAKGGAQARFLHCVMFHSCSSAELFPWSWVLRGAGRQTLLSMLGCLLSPDEGSVFVDDVAVNQLAENRKGPPFAKKKIGFVFSGIPPLPLTLGDRQTFAIGFRTFATPKQQSQRLGNGRDNLLNQFGSRR